MTIFPQKRQTLYLSLAKLIRRWDSSLADVCQELAEVEDNWIYRPVIARLANAVRSGKSLHAALAMESLYFSKRDVDLVRIGETAGKLPETLELLGNADFAGSTSLWTAWGLIAGCLLMVLGNIAWLMVLIVPKFAKMFDEMLAGEPLPALTRWVMVMSDILRHHLVMFILFMTVLFIIFALLKQINPLLWHDRSPRLLPTSRDYPLEQDCMLLCQRLSIMTLGGVSIEEALNASLVDAQTHALRYHLKKWILGMKQGETLGYITMRNVVKRGPLQLLQTGLSRVPLDNPTPLLVDLTATFASRAKVASPLVQGDIFPILFVFSACVIGLILLAMFMPLIKLIERLG